MTREFLYRFISKYRYAVLSTVTEYNRPESALIGFVVTPGLEVFFDTVTTSRKYHNLISNPYISMVIGWDKEQTVQYEGLARIPSKGELDNLLNTYFRIFPDGVERQTKWKDIAYFCVDPEWVRYSDFNTPQVIEEMSF